MLKNDGNHATVVTWPLEGGREPTYAMLASRSCSYTEMCAPPTTPETAAAAAQAAAPAAGTVGGVAPPRAHSSTTAHAAHGRYLSRIIQQVKVKLAFDAVALHKKFECGLGYNSSGLSSANRLRSTSTASGLRLGMSGNSQENVSCSLDVDGYLWESAIVDFFAQTRWIFARG